MHELSWLCSYSNVHTHSHTHKESERDREREIGTHVCTYKHTHVQIQEKMITTSLHVFKTEDKILAHEQPLLKKSERIAKHQPCDYPSVCLGNPIKIQLLVWEKSLPSKTPQWRLHIPTPQ